MPGSEVLRREVAPGGILQIGVDVVPSARGPLPDRSAGNRRPAALTRAQYSGRVEPKSVEVIERAYRAFAERDLDELVKLSAADIEVTTMTGALAGRDEPYRGHAGLGHYLADVADTWDEIELLPHEFRPLEDGRVLVFGRVRAWRKNSFVDAPNAWMWRLRSGLVTDVQILADPETARLLLRRA
jgi:ketosteroid isomerase-like protein